MYLSIVRLKSAILPMAERVSIPLSLTFIINAPLYSMARKTRAQ